MPRKLDLTITGHELLDRRLKRWAEDDNVGVRKATRQGLREAVSKVVRPDFEARVPVDTGAFQDAVAVRAVKRSRTKIGSRLVILRDKLFRKRWGRRVQEGQASRFGRVFFYPAIIELGGFTKADDRLPPRRPVRDALYQNENRIIGKLRGVLRWRLAQKVL